MYGVRAGHFPDSPPDGAYGYGERCETHALSHKTDIRVASGLADRSTSSVWFGGNGVEQHGVLVGRHHTACVAINFSGTAGAAWNLNSLEDQLT
jgi:hypothetical protein